MAKDALNDPLRVERTSGVPIFITDDTAVDHFYYLAERIVGERAKASIFWLPVLLTYPTARLLEFLAKILQLTLPLHPTALISFLGGVAIFSRLRANINLLYEPRYTDAEAIQRTRKYFASYFKIHNN
jgi:hypothetical protein